jgi:hypothetical protein
MANRASKDLSRSLDVGGSAAKFEGLQRGGEGLEKFRESLHVLHPILAAAGLEIEWLGGYSLLQCFLTLSPLKG